MGNNSSYIIYISDSYEKVRALHNPMCDMRNIHNADWYWSVSTVEVRTDCRIPAVYHSEGNWATIVEHNNGTWNKSPTYEIHYI